MKQQRSSGFTLIEVLVAFAILSMVLAAVYGAISTGLSNERTAAQVTTGILEARSLLDEVGTTRPLEEGTSEGTFASGAHWTLEIAPAEPVELNPRIRRRITAYRVTLDVRDEDRSTRFETLRLAP